MPEKVSWKKKAAFAVFAVLFASSFYVSTTDIGRARLGTFREEAKAQIVTVVGELCAQLRETDAGKCGAIVWRGKHRWFGRVTLDAGVGQPSGIAFVKVVEKLGWISAGSSAGVVEYTRTGLELSFFVLNDRVLEFTVTTDR
jgi:hypothetical protein